MLRNYALAAGAALAACGAVMRCEVRRAFCAVRPPGHHAEHDRAMGFCLFNNVAVAAEALLHEHGLDKVAIVDVDVHHGNGTQLVFEERADVMYISLHEHPGTLPYPGTGYAEERGRGRGLGYTLNLPMEAGSGDEAYRVMFDHEVTKTQRIPSCLGGFVAQLMTEDKAVARRPMTRGQAYRRVT